MIEIIELNQNLKDSFVTDSIDYFWKQWGDSKNYHFYKDCIMNSLQTQNDLPKFYVAVHQDAIVGSYAILRNDLISRQDVFPWFACLFVSPEYRGEGIGDKLLEHAMTIVKGKGYNNLYLSTTLDYYYEKYGWEYFDKGYYFNGEETKIYLNTINVGNTQTLSEMPEL